MMMLDDDSHLISCHVITGDANAVREQPAPPPPCAAFTATAISLKQKLLRQQFCR
jgi:hypothetical protein